MGDTDLETMANVTIAEYDYEDEAFDNVSLEAKEFIDSLLVKDQAYDYINIYFKLSDCEYFQFPGYSRGLPVSPLDPAGEGG